MELSAGLVVADRFRLVRPLGQGGMGAVWLAQHTGLDVPCAVKFIHEEAAQSTDVRARFEREAKAAAQLRSPHVVQILDHGVWQGAPYIAMELLEGEDLAKRLKREGSLPPRDTLAIAVQVGRALGKAHAAGLVHRDLKPSNIFLVHDDDREIAKVLDFGIAKVKVKGDGVDGTTKTGALLGTPFYMSPEQARGIKDVDHRADLWALAVVVYRCLTGRLPFKSDAIGDLLVKIITEPPPVPSQVASVPAGFDAFWARATAREPDLRFQSAKELTEALGEALGSTLPESAEVGMPSRVSQASVSSLASGSFAALTPPAGDPSPPTPAPQDISISVGTSAPPRRRGVVAAVAGVLVLGALAGVLALLGRSGVPEPGAANEPRAPSSPPSAVPSTTAQASAAPVVEPGGPASAPVPHESAAPPGRAYASGVARSPGPLPVPAPTGKPAASPAGKRKTDFGF